jgi:hypothetical protein
MADRRELILAQILTLLGELDGIETAARNLDEMDELRLPAAVLFDGDEVAAENLRATGASGNIVHMTPEIVIALSEVPETIGTTTNAWRARLLSKILLDSTLLALCGSHPHRGARYLGCASSLHAGRAAQVMLTVHFSIAYALNPSDL